MEDKIKVIENLDNGYGRKIGEVVRRDVVIEIINLLKYDKKLKNLKNLRKELALLRAENEKHILEKILYKKR